VPKGVNFGPSFGRPLTSWGTKYAWGSSISFGAFRYSRRGASVASQAASAHPVFSSSFRYSCLDFELRSARPLTIRLSPSRSRSTEFIFSFTATDKHGQLP